MAKGQECPNPQCDETIPADAGRRRRSASGFGPGEFNEVVRWEFDCPGCGWKLARADHPDSQWAVDRTRQSPDED